jgi:hypothetical protein
MISKEMAGLLPPPLLFYALDIASLFLPDPSPDDRVRE